MDEGVWRGHRYRRRLLVMALLALTPLLATLPGSPAARPEVAEAASNEAMQRAWARTDKPVANGVVSRTWMWGPEPFTEAVEEDYADSPGGKRQVQYYDKSRMEITNPEANDDGLWYVTNGLLVVEMMTGKMQVGNSQFVERAPAHVNIAGDPDDPLTYAVLAQRRYDPPVAAGAAITQRVNAAGQVSNDPALAGRGVTAATHVAETNHAVASVFWDFMNASGPIDINGQTVTDKLFVNPFYATGLPVTEAYWATVKIGGTQRDLLVQCFERRCLTYNPENPPAWQVEAGNVGQHYYAWRYGQQQVGDGPSEKANELAAAVRDAATAQERVDALMAVMDALNVGVYSSNGAKILGGAERGPADFYLYDFELQMMAAALERGQTWGLEDLALQLVNIGVLPSTQALDPGIVRSALLGGVADAKAAPDELTSLSPLILRQLALAQPAPYDLFDNPAASAIRFDALGYFLLLAELTVPAVAGELPLAEVNSNLIEESAGVLKAADLSAQGGPCDPSALFDGNAFKDAYGWSKIYAELVGLVPETVASVTVIIDALHGAVLAYSVGVSELDQRLETHYGHDGPGEQIVFRIQVEMRDDVSPALIDCGWIAGATFPPKGPIQGVSIHWFWSSLEKHGQIDCGKYCPSAGGNGLSIDATGPDGIATLTFKPWEEQTPGDGWYVEEHGVVTGVALYQSKFTNLLGSYGQYLTPKSGSTRWVVARHEPPGWNVTMTVQYNASSLWRHIGFYKPWEYFEETAAGTGSMTFKTYIPITSLNVDGFQDFALEGSGSGQTTLISEEHSEVGAFWHWTQNCKNSFNTSWTGVLGVNEIYTDASGTHYVLPYKATPPYWHQMSHSGTKAAGKSPCPGGMPTSTIFESVLFNVPAFTLTEGVQEYTANQEAICLKIGEFLAFPWHQIPDQTSVRQFCDVEAKWTIQVVWGQPPGV